MCLASELDEMSLPKGWTHAKIIREAHETGARIRRMISTNGVVALGPKEVDHMSNLLGYLAKHSIALREALLESTGKGE